MSSMSDENRECPLCLEPLEMDDLNFFPCTCGYQICRFCWHRIRTNENGLCPACRKQYSEDPANFKPLTAEELQKIKNEKRQKDIQRKQKISENRKHLANVRVVQKNLVFVVGLPTRLADADELKKSCYFGRFGKIVKVICNQSTSYAGTQGPSASAYVTYQRSDDALRAIQSVNNSKIDGRTLKASLGTTKYCSNFLKKLQCPKQDCMYLHELGDEAASFTKEDMQAGKHQEYERKLCEQMIANSNQNRKQQSPTEQVDSTFFQKERWPSPPKRDDNRSNSTTSNTNSQSSQDNSSPELDSSPLSEKIVYCQAGISFSSKLLDGNESSSSSSENADFGPIHVHSQPSEKQPPQQQPPQEIVNHLITEPKSITNLPPNHCISSSFFPAIDSLSNDAKILENHIPMAQQKISSQKSPPPGIFTEPITASHMTNSHLYKAPGFHSNTNMVNGLSHANSQLKNLVSVTQDWTDPRSREFLKYKMPDMMLNGTVHSIGNVNHEDMNCSSSSFISNRHNMVPLSRLPGVQSGVESVNHMYNGVNTGSKNLKSSYPASDNSSSSQDDDLGFDPWHESSKGLAEMMMKEADDKAKAFGILLSRSSGHYVRRNAIPMESSSVNNPYIENSRFVRHTAPPPGFSLNNYGANTVSRPSYGDAFPNKSLPVMSMYNQSSSAHMPTQYQQQMHPQSVNSLNNVLHSSTDSGIRSQSREWQENITNMHQKNTDLHFGSLSHRLPAHVGKVNSLWNTTNNPPDLPWLQQEQSVNHGFSENRNTSPNLERMLQQLKLSDQASKLQNHLKYSTYSSYRGGNS